MNTLVALSDAIRPRIIRLAEVLSARIGRLAEVLSAKVGSLLSAIADRARPLVGLLAGASFAPPFAVAAAVIVAAAGLPAFAPFALLGLRHLAFACLFHAVLRLAPRHRLASAGSGLRTAMAVALLWIAAASFGAGQAIAPRMASAVTASAAEVPSDTVPGADGPPTPTGAPEAVWLARARCLKSATNGRA